MTYKKRKVQLITSMRDRAPYCLIPRNHPAYRCFPGLPIIPA